MVLTSEQKELLKEKVYRLLEEVGMKIENEEIESILLKNGCEETPSGRIRILRKLIEEMSIYQKKTQKEDDEDQTLHLQCGIDWAHSIIWNRRQNEIRQRLQSKFMMSAFDCGPTKYYDYQNKKLIPVDTRIFIEMMKFAQSTPEIGYISTWYRQDVPQKTERMDSLILALKYTDKVDGIEAIYPEQIKYLKEIGEIISGTSENTPYLAGSQCITSPLVLERRSAEDIVERARLGIKRYHIASMPTIGVSTPVTLAGSVVMSAAEVLGGMAAAYSIDPESDLSGRAISMVTDMRTGNSVSTGPETTILSLAVKELFDTFWGGHLWVEVFFSPSIKEPGLMAVYENLYGVYRYSKLTKKPDIPYPGMGTLGEGGIGSPAQFMLDLEIRKSEFALKNKIIIDEETLPFEEICKITRERKEFLSSEHTLKHFRKLWSSNIFNFKYGDEKNILDKCDALWRENLKNYQPPEWSREKIKALDDLLTKAKKELL
ncbi:MAG: hypothetical protein COZ37_04115 [bacterium (Candidatus Ratteibacteria) CG_4_10_14_3_um_filter_41_18]|uniref:Trimethylamine methyltransferase n=5 Tax=Bacteria candidate phyla TaxID=1783234 RepID=A0A2M7YI38_9BACT|nr:MAG: hypothetical protein COS11_06230 [bacterium (Candidatus Ratteibacteria) CG01_land_8_20_14_3_00_40_19]PIW31614.1 MAG: hypothetical protein COW28_06995 [bacterium (Candidatus Ratteibacteria) CG15_BIG_FIL_POST_REV_8_21_14_020_41_12]PIX77171.1 MAG: hypothetical protein COZ37_04115 [bacterium (Candidatus Ratteibacteria) CG_4_10_14_3_um_filter_41_18]PJA62641.1 MAG: hypothetical protein CO162_00075 [bacterium (Candidatus Ratteibacteria) CG_4_9_14_3_um_filter_41_21]HCG76603.1 hypothetical prote